MSEGASGAEGSGLRASFGRAVVFTLITRIGVLPLGLLQGAILARRLMPTGLGLYSVLLLDINMTVTALSLGLPGALSVLIGERPQRLRPLLLLGLRWGFLALLLPTLFTCLLALRWPGVPARVDRLPGEIALVGGAVLCQYLRDVLGSLLLGTQQFSAQNQQALVLALFQLLLCVGLYQTDLLTPHTAVAIQVAGNVLLCLMSGWSLRKIARVHGLWQPEPGSATDAGPQLTPRALSMGGRNFLHIIPDTLLMRIDVYLLQRLLHQAARQQVGLYQAGVRVAEMVLMVPGTLSTVLFAKAAAREDLTHLTLTCAKISLYLGLLAVGMMACFGQPLLLWFYGPRYAGSFLPCLLVLLGCCFMGFASPLAGTLSGEGAYPRSVVLSQAVALFVNVAVNLYLIPRHGVIGAALASTIAYLVSAVILSAAFALRYQVPLKDLLRPESPLSIWRSLRQRTQGA